MLTFKNITFENIGRFIEPQTVDFTSMGSLVQLDAVNHNTGGSSGAGKSTVLKAIDFLLGLNDVSNGILQSRLTKESMQVIGNFDFNGLPLRIQRGKKLLIDLNGEITTGSSKLAEEKLDEIIGMPRDLFRKILHKRQGEGGFFLDMGATDTHKFLTGCLNLEEEQKKVIVLDQRLSSLSLEESQVKSAIAGASVGLEATNQSIFNLGPEPVLDFDPSVLQELKNRSLEATEDHKKLLEHNKSELLELEKTIPSFTSVPFDRTNIELTEQNINQINHKIKELEKAEQNRQFEVKNKISDIQNQINKIQSDELGRQYNIKFEISKIEEEINKLQRAEQTRQAQVKSDLNLNQLSQLRARAQSVDGNKAKEQGIALSKELQKIKASICPTCEQGWVNETVKIKEQEILLKLQELKNLVLLGMAADKELAILEEQAQVLTKDLQPRVIEELDFRSRINVLRDEAKPKAPPEVNIYMNDIENLKLGLNNRPVPETLELKAQLDSYNKELLKLRKDESEHQFIENAKIQMIVAEFELKRQDLRKIHEDRVKLARAKQITASEIYNMAANKITNFEESKNRFAESLNKFEIQKKKYSDSLLDYNTKLADITEEIELANESKKAIKSYLSASFEDALDSIGDTATKFIRSIPNMSTATIQFEGLKETKEGKVKEEVTCIISMDGEIGIPVKSLSGGEKSSTDLAIDLAVVELIQNRTGKGSNLYIMDEPFQFLDTINIQQILEMISSSNVSKSIILVDHNPIIGEMVTNKIIVSREGHTSRIFCE